MSILYVLEDGVSKKAQDRYLLAGTLSSLLWGRIRSSERDKHRAHGSEQVLHTPLPDPGFEVPIRTEGSRTRPKGTTSSEILRRMSCDSDDCSHSWFSGRSSRSKPHGLDASMVRIPQSDWGSIPSSIRMVLGGSMAMWTTLSQGNNTVITSERLTSQLHR